MDSLIRAQLLEAAASVALLVFMTWTVCVLLSVRIVRVDSDETTEPE